MVIHNFHLMCIPVAPDETDPPLVIDPDAVLANAVAFQEFQPIARRRKQITQRPRPVQVLQLSPGRVLNLRRQLTGTLATEDSFGFTAREGGYH